MPQPERGSKHKKQPQCPPVPAIRRRAQERLCHLTSRGGRGVERDDAEWKSFFFKGVVLIKSSSMRPTERQTVR